VRSYVHPNAAGLAGQPSVILVRPVPGTWLMPAVAGVLLVVSLVLPWATVGDRVAATAVAGSLFAGSLALATSRWEVQGPFLVGVGVFVVHCIAASHVAGVEEWNGVAVVRADGTRAELGAMTYRHALSPGGRAAARVAREAEAVRTWAAAYGSAELPYGARLMTADPRWATLGGIVLAVVLCPVLSTGFALSIGLVAL
jgi:hypothetical protein